MIWVGEVLFNVLFFLIILLMKKDYFNKTLKTCVRLALRPEDMTTIKDQHPKCMAHRPRSSFFRVRLRCFTLVGGKQTQGQTGGPSQFKQQALLWSGPEIKRKRGVWWNIDDPLPHLLRDVSQPFEQPAQTACVRMHALCCMTHRERSFSSGEVHSS